MTGSSGSTTTTTSGPPSQVLTNYNDLVGAAKGVATQPLKQYSGSMVAGFTPQQQQGFSDVSNAEGIGVPYINAAAQEYGAATTPLWPSLQHYGTDTVNQYLSPYTEDVTKGLTGLYNEQNKEKQSELSGNAAVKGAFGGDREAVAQSLAAQQETLAQAPTLAQVEQQGFQGAQGEFNTQQQQELGAKQANAWLNSQAGFGMAGLGTEAQTQALTGANALSRVGGQQQSLAQEQLNIPYEQFVQTQAYPYQSLNFLAPIVEGTGSLSGGTSATTTPGPSTLSQVGGLGLAGAGLLGSTGAFGSDGWLTGSGGTYGGGGDYGTVTYKKEGGRVAGFADGGDIGALPEVPKIDLSYIPIAPSGGAASKSALSPFQPSVTTQSDSGGGGSSALGAIGSIASLAKLAFLKDGGAANADTAETDPTGLPKVPKINLDFISPPGPVSVRGEGPPKPPSAPQQSQGQGLAGDLTGLAKGATSLFDKGTFGDKGDTGYQAGGGVPLGVAASFGGASPATSGLYRELAQMPQDRLEQLAVQYPPTTSQGQMVQRALTTKRATPGGGVANIAGPTAAAIGSDIAPTGAATGANMAAGGAANFVTEDELDPYPVVDHSGDTVRVRYPSEGKELDLGIPSIKPRRLATGGIALSDVPHVSLSGGQWGVQMPTLPNGTNGTNGTNGGLNGGPNGGYGGFGMPSNNITIPQLSTNLFNAAPMQPGGGYGDWFVALPQYTPSGGGVDANGLASYPSKTASTPGVGSILSAFGQSVPSWATAARGGRIGLAEGGDADYIEPPASGPKDTPDTPASANDPQGALTPGGGGLTDDLRPAFSSGFAPDTGLAAPPKLNSTEQAIARIRDPLMRDLSKVNPAVLSLPPAFDATTQPQSYQPPFTPTPPAASSAGDDAGSRMVSGLPAPAAPAKELGGTAIEKELPSDTAPSGPPPVPSEAKRVSPIWATGDSQAWGLVRQGGLQGTTSDRPGDPNVDASIGRSPKDQYVYIARRAKEGYWQGKNVVLATGAQNDPSQIGFVPWQIEALREGGANVVGLSGFTNRGVKGTDMAPIAQQVSAMAEEHGVPFGGLYTEDIRPTEATPLHLTPQGYKKLGDYYRDYGDGTGQPPDAVAPQLRSSGEPMPTPTTEANVGAKGPVTPALVQQAGITRDPEGYASLANYLWRGEASDFNVLYGNGRFSDYSQHPADKGWQGGYGPDGRPTHAAGLPQFQTGTWHDEATKLHLTDFSPASQVKAGIDLAETTYHDRTGGDLLTDFKAGKLDQINSALHDQWTSLGTGSVAGGARGTRLGGGRLINEAPPVGGGSPDAQPLQQASTIAETALRNTPPEHRGGMMQWMQSPWFLAFLAGAGMLASRSPFPGVALGEGLLTAARGAETIGGLQNRQEIAEIRAQHTADLTNVRSQSLVERASRDKDLADYRLQSLQQKQQSGQDNLDLRRQIAEANASKAAADLELHRQVAEASVATRTANLQLQEQKLETAQTKVQQGTYKPPIEGEGPSDPNDPKSERVHGLWYHPAVPDPQKPNGGSQFFPGVGSPKAATGQRAIYQDLITSGAAKDMSDAIRIEAELKRDPRAAQNSHAYAGLVEREATRLQSGMPGASQPQIQALAKRNVDAYLAAAPQGQGAVAPAPAAPATAPAAATPAAPPPTTAAPALPMPGWAKGEGRSMGGKPIYPDPTGWYYVNPDGSRGALVQ